MNESETDSVQGPAGNRAGRDQTGPTNAGPNPSEREAVPGWNLRLATLGVLIVALVALVPTTGDYGLTWDEPAYRYSQMLSIQWWEQAGRVRSWADVAESDGPSHTALFLALWTLRHQLSSAAGGSIESGGARDFWFLDERHPVTAHGLGH